jgi:hypothetical protein
MITNKNTREEIIKELGLGGLPSEAQDELISKLAENILKKVAVAMLDKFPEDKRGPFEELVSTGDANQVYAFLSDNVPDAATLIQQEMRNGIAEIKQAII